MEYVIGLFFGIVGSLVAAEVYCWAPNIARRCVERAVLRLPESERDRFREEWLAHLGECPGSLGKLWHSMGCLSGARAISAAGSKIALVRASNTERARSIAWKGFLTKVIVYSLEMYTKPAWYAVLFGFVCIIFGMDHTNQLVSWIDYVLN